MWNRVVVGGRHVTEQESELSEVQQATPLHSPTSVIDRRLALVEWTRDRRVVHLGCVDEPLLEQRVRDGQLLHASIAAQAAWVLGVDIAESGLERLRSLVPGDYVQMDVQRIDVAALPQDVDLVLAPEIIEHLPNPGAFLDGLARYLRHTGAEAIITTPNGYHLANVIRFAFRRAEYVHPDHVLVFTPTTLDRMLSTAGLEVVERHVHDWNERGTSKAWLKRLASRCVLAWNPWLAVGLIWRVRAVQEPVTTP